ncbi:MAG TPA: hypothetical protein DCZ59_10050 [Bacteroidetes bacterium]|nr:hypothetical protein [Bacteroidota bacterium]
MREHSERLHVDLSIISELGRDQRSPCDQDVRKLAKAFMRDARILRIAWLRDVDEVGALESFAAASAMNERVLVYESGIWISSSAAQACCH